MNLDFDNKVVLITGAGSGLGRAAAVQIIKEGAKMALVDWNADKLEETKRLLSNINLQADVIYSVSDVSKEKDVQNFVEKAVSVFGGIDGFFNNAGIEGKTAKIEDFDGDDFRQIIDINLFGIFYGLKYVLPVMKKQGRGQIVNTASLSGFGPAKYHAAYCASKHGVIGLTRTAVVEYAQYGISINAICPGPILTDIVQKNAEKYSPENPEAFLKKVGENYPAKRIGRPEELAPLVALLLSGKSGYINGALVPIDGGATSNI